MGSSILGSAGAGRCAQDMTLTIESWRNDDLAIWQDKLIPAFEAKPIPASRSCSRRRRRPNTTPRSTPSSKPARPATSSPAARSTPRSSSTTRAISPTSPTCPAWRTSPTSPSPPGTTDDGAATFCVPMASVIHGFIYNKDAFDKLGIAVPATEAEFFAALDKIKADGTYIPLAMGTKDLWEAATMGYQNIGPNYWKGEEGRLALIKGEQKLTDPAVGRALCDARQVEGLSRRRLRGADLSGQPEPVHARPRRHLSGRLVGNLRLQHAGAVQDGRLPAAGAERRRHLLHLRPHRHRHRHERQERRMPDAAKTFLTGSPRRSSPPSTPTRCRASSPCPRRR